jgi:hypothetical protein
VSPIARPSRRTLLLLDAALATWTAALVVVGVLAAVEVRGISKLSDTVVVASGALRQTANLVDELGRLPVVGGDADELADRVRRTARTATRRAVASKRSVRRLAVYLGTALVLVPAVPLALYLPLRVGWSREGRWIRRMLDADDARLDPWLARRALLLLPPDRLAPGRDERALADAELRRLGFRRTRR